LILIFFIVDHTTEHAERIAVLESKVQAFDKVAERTMLTSLRMDAMEGQVSQFTGALESFLGRISIDNHL
jgi:hypothetical protein